jgi:hypothetical protein
MAMKSPMTGENRPLSEIYKVAGDDWADKVAAASMLEDTITVKRSQRQLKLIEDNPGMAINKSELLAKADGYNDVYEAVEARKAANKARVYLDSIKMRHSECMNEEANHRAEARL